MIIAAGINGGAYWFMNKMATALLSSGGQVEDAGSDLNVDSGTAEYVHLYQSDNKLLLISVHIDSEPRGSSNLYCDIWDSFSTYIYKMCMLLYL